MPPRQAKGELGVRSVRRSSRKTCINCGEPVAGHSETKLRGPDCAWYVQCAECAALVSEQLEVVEDRPGGQSIQILQCRRCGERRACRPGWTTRCHTCLDERTSPAIINGWLAIYHLLPDELGVSLQEIEASIQQSIADDGRTTVTDRDRAEEASSYLLTDEYERRTHLGWTLLAADIKGLPWFFDDTLKESHGTWARHDRCGTVQTLNLGRGRTECKVCPPEPDSRTHRARANDPHLLYLVRHHRLQKFGHGDNARVRAHIRGGAEVVQVLEATHEEVVRAEAKLKRRFKGSLRADRRRGLLASFGRGTEVLPASVHLDLTSVLDGVDVTYRFAST